MDLAKQGRRKSPAVNLKELGHGGETAYSNRHRRRFHRPAREVKGRIHSAQTRAVVAVNRELVIPRLASALFNELPEVKGFFKRNIDRMIAFYRAYPNPADFSPPPMANLPRLEESRQASAVSPALLSEPPDGAQLPNSLL